MAVCKDAATTTAAMIGQTCSGVPAPGAIVLALAVTLASAAVALGAVDPPVRVTLDGVEGARPGMTASAVSAAWGMPMRPSYELRADCGQALFEGRGLDGYAIFTPRDSFGAVFLRKGVMTGKGIRIGSSLAQLRRAYSRLTSRPDRYVHGGRHYFLRRARAPHWELRFDVSPGKRVTQIVFGTRSAVQARRGLRLGLLSRFELVVGDVGRELLALRLVVGAFLLVLRVGILAALLLSLLDLVHVRRRTRPLFP